MEEVLVHGPVEMQPLPLAVIEVEDKRSLVPDLLRGFIVEDEQVPTIIMPEAQLCIVVGPASALVGSCPVPGSEAVHLSYLMHENSLQIE